jgi:hypothetical protein
MHVFDDTLLPVQSLALGDLLVAPWAPERYKLWSKVWKVGFLAPTEVTDENINVLDMPFQLPDGEAVLPELPAWLRELVEAASLFEQRLHPASKHMYAYLTVNQGLVCAGHSQRRGGAHFDGMQGARYPHKLPPCHQYLYSTAAPTLIYEQPFDLAGLDPAEHNFFAACDRQKRGGRQPRAGEIVLTTAYTVHESPCLIADTCRTFVRVEFSYKRADREGNTRNPALDTSHWDYQPRPIPQHLV